LPSLIKSKNCFIIFSNQAHQSYVKTALEDGAMGYVLKHSDESTNFVQVIKRVMSGKKYTSHQISTFE
jgi:DNA-binding NarL/FixJ family response regulator